MAGTIFAESAFKLSKSDVKPEMKKTQKLQKDDLSTDGAVSTTEPYLNSADPLSNSVDPLSNSADPLSNSTDPDSETENPISGADLPNLDEPKIGMSVNSDIPSPDFCESLSETSNSEIDGEENFLTIFYFSLFISSFN